ncbi:MAG: DJ-1/PfpI family protein [Opitutales bacterium]|nr:DJ-1/PfpI family protein [Opitutales bacterium]
MKKVLTILTDGVEETEAVAPLDLLQRAGTQNCLAALAVPAGTRTVTGRSNLQIGVDTTVEEILDGKNPESLAGQFDALFIPGGPGTWKLLDDGNAAKIAAAFAKAGKTVAAICAAPLIVKAAGLIDDDTKISAHSCTWQEIPQAAFSAPYQIDGPLLTSRGAGTAVAFGIEFVRILYGNAVAQKIAADIML